MTLFTNEWFITGSLLCPIQHFIGHLPVRFAQIKTALLLLLLNSADVSPLPNVMIMAIYATAT